MCFFKLIKGHLLVSKLYSTIINVFTKSPPQEHILNRTNPFDCMFL